MIFFSGIKGHGIVQTNLILLLAACLLTIPSLSQARDVSFVWEPNQESISGYKLYYKTGDSSTEPFDGTGIVEGASPIIVGDVTSFTVTDLADDQTYQFALTAFNEFGESGYSTVVTISPGESALRSVDFTWNPNPDPVTGYKLYYKTGDTPDAPFTGTGFEQGDSPIIIENVTNFTINGLDTETTYQFALTAYNANGESGFSDIVTIRSTPVPVILNISHQ